MRARSNRLSTLLLAGTMALTPAAMLAQATPVASPVTSPVASPAPTCTTDLRVIGQQVLPNDLVVGETPVGGLSGIDYDETNNAWYILSDDRSDEAPARFYGASFTYDQQTFTGVELTSATTLLQEDGSPFPNEAAGGNVPDPESIRVDPQNPANLWWTSEGNYELDLDPFVAQNATDGSWVGTVAAPTRYQASAGEELGPRNNLVWEGMDFSADGETVWVLDEGPLFQDGAVPTVDAGGTNRLVQMDRSGNVLAEYAYELEKLPADPGELFGTTGTTELLTIDATRFLVIERATVQDASEAYINYIKLYIIDTAGATDVKDMESLDGAEYTPVSKTLVYDMNACGMSPIDNMEGLTWGPVLENGNRSLVMISDNNFNDTQVQLFVVFEVPAELLAS